jgi:hypothetical protein
LPTSKEHPLDQLPMKREAQLFRSSDTHGRAGYAMGLVAGGLDQLTPQFIDE